MIWKTLNHCLSLPISRITSFFDGVHHIPTVDEITFPGITLVGTCPTVYKIKVAAELSNAVMGGTFPANSVVIYLQMPRLSRGNCEVVQSPHPFTL